MNTIKLPPPATTNTTVLRRPLSQKTTTLPSMHAPFKGHFKSVNFGCKAILKSNNTDVLRKSDSTFVDEHQAIRKYIKSIKSVFGSLDDGVISASAYDTAWVALIENVDGPNDGPQFPSCLKWIVSHQLIDGSWGEPSIFSASDRLINTLACVVALTWWKIHPNKCEKGLKFLEDNIDKLGDEKEEHKTHGLELAFPALLELARKLDIKVPYDSPVIKDMYKRRDRKLLKIPREKVHKTPTIMLYSLEGMKDLEWEKILKLQSENGSIVYSTAATSFAYMQTKDQKCLSFLTNLVSKFKGGVPHVYPVEIFERVWMVDRLQRLGIARYFQPEIKECIGYIYRYWDEQGTGITRFCNLPDLDDTCMGFRLLRANGYQVTPDVFRNFEKDGQFMCYPGQSAEAVTVMFNLYRASQMLFPGEKFLDDAKKFSYNFLTEKRSTKQLLDKWLITKDLPGEVEYALDVPWYASLPRLEARYYVEQYGGGDDLWLAKTIYRMGNISNNKYLELAKLDYNHCQTIHQLEWRNFRKWYKGLNMEESLNTSLLRSFYEAATSIFEPERSNERVAWAKTSVMLNALTSFFARPQFSNTDIQALVIEFTNVRYHNCENGKQSHVMIDALHETIDQIAMNTMEAYGVDICTHLHSIWNTWLLKWQKGVTSVVGEAELIVKTINLSSGRCLLEEPFSHLQYQRLSFLINDISQQISHKEDPTSSLGIESKMQELVQLVLCDMPNDLDPISKETFLTVAKTFYYRALFDPESINQHIGKVLFENVI